MLLSHFSCCRIIFGAGESLSLEKNGMVAKSIQTNVSQKSTPIRSNILTGKKTQGKLPLVQISQDPFQKRFHESRLYYVDTQKHADQTL